MDWILFLKLLHIVSAVVAVGANLTYAFWIRRAERDPEHLAWTIGTIRRLDNSIATPSYVVVLITGLLMVFGGWFSFSTSWIQLAIGLYVLVVVVAVAAFAPTFRRQLAAAQADPRSAEYRELARRSTIYGWLTTGIVLVILYLMVFKPTLW
jgi:uncharacterized membrane protein